MLGHVTSHQYVENTIIMYLLFMRVYIYLFLIMTTGKRRDWIRTSGSIWPRRGSVALEYDDYEGMDKATIRGESNCANWAIKWLINWAVYCLPDTVVESSCPPKIRKDKRPLGFASKMGGAATRHFPTTILAVNIQLILFRVFVICSSRFFVVN